MKMGNVKMVKKLFCHLSLEDNANTANLPALPGYPRMSGLFIIILYMFRVSDAIVFIYNFAYMFTVVSPPLANVLDGDNSSFRILQVLSSVRISLESALKEE